MKHSEIIHNIKNLLAKGLESDDERFKDRHLAFIINYYRAKLLKQDAQTHKGIATKDIQDLGKVELLKVDSHECCDIEDCIYRTKLKLPTSLEVRTKRHGLTYVGTYHGKPFQETTYIRARHDASAVYTSKDPKWYIKGEYIYFVNLPGMIEFVNIQGLFEDPKAANKFRTCDCPQNDELCNIGYNYDYPLSAHHVDTIVKMIAGTELNILLSVVPDLDNNGKDDN